jgi:hypothetical protein
MSVKPSPRVSGSAKRAGAIADVQAAVDGLVRRTRVDIMILALLSLEFFSLRSDNSPFIARTCAAIRR